jgi:nicotinate dehydrogenase subunit A
MEDKMTISIQLNGEAILVGAEPQTPLLYVLRNDCGINSAKFGCGMAQCGACTVLVDGKAIRSCVTTVSSVNKANVTTLEALGNSENLHILQKAFIDEQAAQCGYCTSGMIMSSKALLDVNPHPTDKEIRAALAGNLCRCGTHERVIRAVKLAVKGGL